MTARVCLSLYTQKHQNILHPVCCVFFTVQPFFRVCVEKRMKALSCSTTSQFMGRLLLIMSILKRPRQESFGMSCLVLSTILFPPPTTWIFFLHNITQSSSSSRAKITLVAFLFPYGVLIMHTYCTRRGGVCRYDIPKRPIVFHHPYTPRSLS